MPEKTDLVKFTTSNGGDIGEIKTAANHAADKFTQSPDRALSQGLGRNFSIGTIVAKLRSRRKFFTRLNALAFGGSM